MRHVNTELCRTASRLDLRLHYILIIFDFGCTSAIYSCTSNTQCQNIPVEKIMLYFALRVSPHQLHHYHCRSALCWQTFHHVIGLDCGEFKRCY